MSDVAIKERDEKIAALEARLGRALPKVDFCIGEIEDSIHLTFSKDRMKDTIDNISTDSANNQLQSTWKAISKSELPSIFACFPNGEFYREWYANQTRSTAENRADDNKPSSKPSKKVESKEESYSSRWARRKSEQDQHWDWNEFQRRVGSFGIGIFPRESGIGFRLVQLGPNSSKEK